MIYCCFISNNPSPSPKIQTWEDEVLFRRFFFKRLWVETKPSEYHWNVVYELLIFLAENGKSELSRTLLVFVLCNSFFERRKLECEVYTLFFSLYNPQQKVATYSSRKWIGAKNRNKSLMVYRQCCVLIGWATARLDSETIRSWGIIVNSQWRIVRGRGGGLIYFLPLKRERAA